jgi:hypothetical protein
VETKKDTGSGNVRIISWNINMFQLNTDLIGRGENIIRTMSIHNPDIYFLQESSNYFLDLVTKYFDYQIVTKTRSHCGYVSLLVKPHIIVTDVKTSIGHISFRYDDLTIVNCHLSPNILDRNQQLREIEDLAPNIIMGDLNFGDNENIENYVDLGQEKSIPTWSENFYIHGSIVKKRLDRVYTNVPIYEFNVCDEYPGESDHLPISILLRK